MSNYEKARLANGSIYEIVPGGLRENSDKTKLTLITRCGNRTLSEVEAETDIMDNVAKVTILDAAGDECDIKKGYRYQVGCKKEKGYVVGREEVDTGTKDSDGNPIKEYRDLVDAVYIIELSIGDIRSELEEAKAEIASLNETVDMLVVAALGV